MVTFLLPYCNCGAISYRFKSSLCVPYACIRRKVSNEAASSSLLLHANNVNDVVADDETSDSVSDEPTVAAVTGATLTEAVCTVDFWLLILVGFCW